MFNFKADIAILLNITPDHLDRYENSFDKYAESKYKILQNQSIHDAFIYCADDEIILKKLYSKNISSQLFSFSLSGEKREGAYLTNNKLHFTIKNKTFTMTLEELALQGKHNIYNSMAAGIAARLVEVRKENIKSCLSDFQNVEHRLEFIANIHGIEFINDSKATNVNSVWYALESMDKPVIWIAGGQDKGNDYTKLRELVKTKVKAIICLGIDNTKIYAAFFDLVKNITETQSMEEAVAFAYHLAESGEKVLLSPACASFDLFENYQERGTQFKQAVKNL
jgi:UDP-N-acetylmuramoylalanine--D-glutamate ligase